MSNTVTARRDENSVPSLLAVSSVDGVSLVELWANPSTHRLLVELIGGSGSGLQFPLTGSVNGSNQTFTWATARNVLVVDGAPLQATEQGGTVNWTGTTTTVLTVPPNNSIFAEHKKLLTIFMSFG